MKPKRSMIELFLLPKFIRADLKEETQCAAPKMTKKHFWLAKRDTRPTARPSPRSLECDGMGWEEQLHLTNYNEQPRRKLNGWMNGHAKNLSRLLIGQVCPASQECWFDSCSLQVRFELEWDKNFIYLHVRVRSGGGGGGGAATKRQSASQSIAEHI